MACHKLAEGNKPSARLFVQENFRLYSSYGTRLF